MTSEPLLTLLRQRSPPGGARRASLSSRARLDAKHKSAARAAGDAQNNSPSNCSIPLPQASLSRDPCLPIPSPEQSSTSSSGRTPWTRFLSCSPSGHDHPQCRWAIKKRLRIRVAHHGRSMEEEARDMLRAALSVEEGRLPPSRSAIRRRWRHDHAWRGDHLGNRRLMTNLPD